MRRVPYDERFLALSYEWLQDPEIRRLIDAPAVTREGQQAWYDSLPGRTDYAVWGIEYDGVPVGVLGLKRIGEDDGAEYFIYIGERAYWGRGIAAWGLADVAEEARRRGLRFLYGRILKVNERSLGVHLSNGFEHLREEDDVWWVAYPLDRPSS
jgi:RimJ/RimL family protein N-acetyltransferase